MNAISFGTLNSHVQDSALCFIQPVLVPGRTSGTVTLNQVKAAASRIVDECVFSPSSGGIAMDIGRLSSSLKNRSDLNRTGGDGNVAVVVAKFKPQVTCRGVIPDWFSCNAILYKMDASLDLHYFGPPSDPRTQVGLPATIIAGTS